MSIKDNTLSLQSILDTVNNLPTAGGKDLNFKVVGGTTQPENPTENMIWVNTDSINNYYFSVTQPENLVDYDVWFFIGTVSSIEFNALKNNGIQVYPVSAKQYMNGVMTDVTAMSYHDGEWVEWIVYLFKSGEGFNSSVYKKLEQNSKITVSGYSVLNYSVASDNSSISLASYANGNDICPLAFDIDLTPYKTMYIDATISKSNGSSAELGLGVTTEGRTSVTDTIMNAARFTPTSNGVRKTYTYSVESINTTKRIFITAWNGRKNTIHNIWFD